MTTIAELELRVDSKPVEHSTSALNDFAEAAKRAKQAGDGFNNSASGGSSGGGLAPSDAPKKVNNLTEAIDQQARKLGVLAEQRKKLDASEIKTNNPAEYQRLNQQIDANIALVKRQGDAVEKLQRAQVRDAEKIQSKADVQQRTQERLIRGVERQENVLSNAAARQQREIDQTIAGLDKQIAAQMRYNKEMEVLNRARATSGMAGPGSNVMSAGEYEHLAKQAAAQRDVSLAMSDTSRNTDQIRNKLETYAATLGKADRAEVELVRATRTLNQALEQQLITQAQYDQMLARFTQKRDTLVASTESNAAAEEKLARQLRSVLGAYDPVTKAQNQYEQNTATLKAARDAGLISEEKFTKALQEQKVALDAVKASQSGFNTMGDEYEDALRKVLPYRAELHNLEVQQRKLDDAKKAGLITTPQQIKDYDQATAAIKRQTAEYHQRIEAANKNVISAKQEAAAMRGLPAQFTDIVVSLQGGQAPLTVLLQQGGQIKDMFGGIGPALQAMGKGLAAMITPLTSAAAVLTLLSVAAYSGSQEVAEFNKAMIQTQGISGVSTNQFSAMREELDNTVGTAGKAAAALTQMAGSGKISGEVFVQIAEAAIKMERATGTAMSEIIDDFASLGKEPVAAAVRLDEKYRFLTTAVLAQADALVRQGKEQEAVNLLQSEMSKTATETADKMIAQAGYIERAWHSVKQVIAETWDALKGIGRSGAAGTAAELARKEAELSALKATPKDSGARNRLRALGYDVSESREATLEKEITQLKQRAQYEDYMAKLEQEAEQRRSKSVRAFNEFNSAYESNLAVIDKVAAAQEAANQVQMKAAAIRKQAAEEGRSLTKEEELRISTAQKAAEQRVKDAKEAEARKGKPKTGPVDTTDVVEAKTNIDAIVTEYDGYFKKISTLRDSNVISESAAYYSQKAILQAQAKELTSSYDKQVEEIKRLQGNKKNSASANISLENQLTKAEAARVKAMEQNQQKQDDLDIKFTASIDKRNASIKSYNDALREQVRALEESGQRAVTGVGRGDRQAGVDQALNDNDRNYARERRRLAERKKEMDPEEYAANLQNLKRAHSDMRDQIIKNDRDIQEANFDWTNGFTKAVENAQDAGMNFASSVNQALTGAFDSAGDALYEFVTTGKLSFSDFASSVIKDMARIASQQAANGILSSLLGIASTAAGAYFGGGSATSAGVSGAGSFGQIGGSYTGTGVFRNAKGAAYDGPIARFAKGDIVSSPTRFAIGGVNPGIGEAGEGGRPEAIMPLQRTNNGDLGVKVSGMGGIGGTVVNVNVTVNSDGSSSTTTDGGTAWQDMGQKIAPIIRNEVYAVINTEMRPGGSIQPQSGR